METMTIPSLRGSVLSSEPGGGEVAPVSPPSMYRGAAFAFVFDTHGRFLLLEESPASRKYMYDLPGGTLEDQESPTVGLHREVLEETGLHIELLSPLCHLKWDMHESGQAILVAFYVARADNPEEFRISSEHVSYRWVTREQYFREKLLLSLEDSRVRELLTLFPGEY
jgi:8-oxo-dGTP diphosphatase